MARLLLCSVVLIYGGLTQRNRPCHDYGGDRGRMEGQPGMYWASSSDTGIWERLTKLLYPRENSHSEMRALKYPSSGWVRELEVKPRRRDTSEASSEKRRGARSQKTARVMMKTLAFFWKPTWKKKMNSCEQQNTVYLFLQDDFEKRKRKAKRLCAWEGNGGVSCWKAIINIQGLMTMPDSHAWWLT